MNIINISTSATTGREVHLQKLIGLGWQPERYKRTTIRS